MFFAKQSVVINMKWSVRHTCFIALVALVAAVFVFLYQFTVPGEPVRYIPWDTSTRVLADGTEEEFDLAGYTQVDEPDDSVYRFTALLPEGLGDGYLLFETSGLELTLYLDGAELYSSTVPADEAVLDMSQARLPLPTDVAGRELTALCRPLGGNALFPPLARFSSDSALEKDAMAYANLRGIPSGAFGLALVLICGLFLLSFVWKRPDWSIIPLIIAAFGMLTQPISITIGYYFLPERLFHVLAWRGVYLIILAAFIAYFIMNRHRDFWRMFGFTALVSAGALIVCYLVSLWRGSYLAGYINSELEGLFGRGDYTGLAFWLTFWMVTVCAMISAYALLRSVAKTRADAQTGALREQLAMVSYHQIEQKLRETASTRHESRHQLTALDALYRKGDMDALGAELARLVSACTVSVPVVYTENIAINTILQDAAARAVSAGVRFEAVSLTPRELPISEGDLCCFLMNLLDNALEAAGSVEEPDSRFIRFRAVKKGSFLAFHCENAYNGKLKRDAAGFPLTTKDEPELHGFGLRRMREIAEKYGSILDVGYTDDTFTVQTALCVSDD